MIVQINRFRPGPSQSVTDSRSFRFSVKIFGQFDTAGRPKNFFHRCPNPISVELLTHHEALIKTAGFLAQIRTRDLPKTKQSANHSAATVGN